MNRIKDKPYVEEVEGAGKPDAEVANEAWRRYKSRNDSVIVDLFQGQLKSKLTCPVCNKVELTCIRILFIICFQVNLYVLGMDQRQIHAAALFEGRLICCNVLHKF